MAKIKRDDYPRDVPEDFAHRLIGWLGNRKIRNYEHFRELMDKYLQYEHLVEILTESDYDNVYETLLIRDRVIQDVSDEIERKNPAFTIKQRNEKAEAVYVERQKIKQEILAEADTLLFKKKILTVKKYTARGKDVKIHYRSRPERWSKVETQFVASRKEMKNKNLLKAFNNHFRNRQRNYGSVVSKRRRL